MRSTTHPQILFFFIINNISFLYIFFYIIFLFCMIFVCFSASYHWHHKGGIDRSLSIAYRFRYVHIDGAKGVDHVRTVLGRILNRHDQQTCSSDCLEWRNMATGVLPSCCSMLESYQEGPHLMWVRLDSCLTIGRDIWHALLPV